MRLWHYKLLQFLPKSQLLSQKRECDLIWKDISEERKTNHILINYIWEDDKYLQNLSLYYWLLKEEFNKRGFAFKFSKNFITKNVYFGHGNATPFPTIHNYEYLVICYYNLKEKFLRGQKDFDTNTFERLRKFIKEEKQHAIRPQY